MSKKYELSRRKALAALGTIGVAGAGAGMGTSALFSDTESFEENQLVAGELNLVVDYYTSVDTDFTADTTGNGENDGGVSGVYQLTDVKPGDTGKLVFCPKIIDNPAYLWAGSSGLTDYENGRTEPEQDVDGSPGGNLGNTTSGAGAGELSENIEVTVSYCEPAELDAGEERGADDFSRIRKLDNPDDYTLADLILELRTGFLLNGGKYPASADGETQTGPCLCIEWEVPSTVGNEIQSDAVEFDFQFDAVQSRNVSDPASENPFVSVNEQSVAVNVPSDAQAGYPGTFRLKANDQVAMVDLSGLAESFPSGTSGADNVGIWLGDANGTPSVEVKLLDDGTFTLPSGNNSTSASKNDFHPMLVDDVIYLDIPSQFGSIGAIANVVDKKGSSTTQAVITPDDGKPFSAPLYEL